MMVTERIKVKQSDALHDLCHASKNLYNRANFLIRQNYFYLGDEIDYKFLNYNDLYYQIKDDPAYRELPAQTAQQTLIVLEKAWKSFFVAMKEWKRDRSAFTGRPKPPKYKNKDGEFIVTFTGQQLNKGRTRNGYIQFPKSTMLQPVKTRIDHFKETRIVPRGISYIIEIIHEKEEKDLDLNKKNVLGVDLGLNNIVTCVNNIGEKPFVIRGGVVKSINQFYNKKRAKLQSLKDLQGYDFETRQMQRLTEKRNWKIKDCFHKISRFMIDHCIVHDIGTIAIGYNDKWKQEINIGKRNNQNFVQIPFYDLVKMIEYKAMLVGIEIVVHEESYTSKASFLDLDEFSHEGCTGRRIRSVVKNGKRCKCNLYRRKNGQKLHGDVNGSYNIARKAIPDAFAEGIEGLALVPISVAVMNGFTTERNKTFKI